MSFLSFTTSLLPPLETEWEGIKHPNYPFICHHAVTLAATSYMQHVSAAAKMLSSTVVNSTAWITGIYFYTLRNSIN